MRSVLLGRPNVQNTLRSRTGDDAHGMLLHMHRGSSISPILNQRRRLTTVLDVIQGIRASGFTIARGLELSSQWNKALAAGFVGPPVGVPPDHRCMESLSLIGLLSFLLLWMRLFTE